MAPTPLTPNGIYKIRNGQFIGLVADLVGGNPYGLIVGTVNRPVNQFDQVCVICSGGCYSLLQ